MHSRTLALALPCLLLATVACSSVQEFAEPHPRTDPDGLLAEQLSLLDDAWHRDSLPPERAEEVPPPEEIHQEIRQLAVFFPRHEGILFTNGVLAYEDNRPETAQRYLDDLLSLDPGHAQAGLLRSRIAMQDGNLPFAESLLNRMVRLNPDHAGLREALAGVLFFKGNYELADRSLAEAAGLGAPIGRVAYHRGLIAETMGLSENAAGYYEQAVANQVEFPDAARRLDAVRAEMGVQVAK